MARRSQLFKNFFRRENAGGFILIGCTLVSMALAASGIGDRWVHFWHNHLNLRFLDFDTIWNTGVNDGLMAVFFLLVGLDFKPYKNFCNETLRTL